MGKKKQVVLEYVAGFSVDEGVSLVQHVLNDLRGEEKWFVNGCRVKRDFARFEVLNRCELKCHRCGVEATHWVVERHRNDHVMPYSLNVYAGNRMLTWDHILPKSLDGSDAPENGRCACDKCNSNRGNEMTLDEMLWVNKQSPQIMFKPAGRDGFPLDELLQLAVSLGRGDPVPEFINLKVVFKSNEWRDIKNWRQGHFRKLGIMAKRTTLSFSRETK